ncbi:MAG: hypothetical protein WDN24_05770 [Sphingomonas sp.]
MKPGSGAAPPDPRDADGLFRAAAAALREGREAQVLEALAAGTRSHPRDSRLWQLLGLALRNLEDLAPAIRALDRAVALAPADALVAHTRARAALEPGFPPWRCSNARARWRLPTDRWCSASPPRCMPKAARATRVAMLDAALRQSPLWIAGHATLAKMRWTMGLDAESAASLDAALRQFPRDPSLHQGRDQPLDRGEPIRDRASRPSHARAARWGKAPRSTRSKRRAAPSWARPRPRTGCSRGWPGRCTVDGGAQGAAPAPLGPHRGGAGACRGADRRGRDRRRCGPICRWDGGWRATRAGNGSKAIRG